jgi:hypothetical protein
MVLYDDFANLAHLKYFLKGSIFDHVVSFFSSSIVELQSTTGKFPLVKTFLFIKSLSKYFKVLLTFALLKQ